jgi:hypothetical protein
MGEWGMLIPVVVALIGLYALHWARQEEVVQPEESAHHLRADQGSVVAGDEAAATGDEALKLGPPPAPKVAQFR